MSATAENETSFIHECPNCGHRQLEIGLSPANLMCGDCYVNMEQIA